MAMCDTALATLNLIHSCFKPEFADLTIALFGPFTAIVEQLLQAARYHWIWSSYDRAFHPLLFPNLCHKGPAFVYILHLST